MATETTTQDSTAREPAPAGPTAKKSGSKKRLVKKPATKKSTAKKRLAKKPVSAKKSTKKSVAKKRTAKKSIAAKNSVAKKSVARKAKPKKRKTKKQPTPNGTTKAQSIRDAFKELGKKARPRDIIAALAAKGITVSSPQVTMTLKAAGLRRGRRRKKAEMAVVTQHPSRNGDSQTFNVSDLIQVKELASKIGGIDKLKESVAALEKLQSIWLGV